MNLRRIFAQAFARRIAYVVVGLLLAALGVGNARAAAMHTDEGDAYTDCMANVAKANLTGADGAPAGSKKCTKNGSTWFVSNSSGNRLTYSTYETDHQFSQSCAVRPTEYAGFALDTVCAKGCKYALGTDATKYRIDQPSSTAINVGVGNYNPTGGTCSAETPAKEAAKPYHCTTLEGGHQLCMDTTGKKWVVSGTTGKKYPWTESQSGPSVNPERTEAFSKSPTAPAPGLPATSVVNRPGEDFKQTTTTTVTNVTNNTTNKITNSINTGTPNTTGEPVAGDGSDNPAQPGDGSGGGGSGEGDGEGNGAGGGGTCDEPPTHTGDPLLGAIYRQAWETRCAVENGKVEGEGTCDLTGTNGAGQGFQCSGDQVLCKVALQQWEERCDAKQAQAKRAVDASLDTGEISYQGDHWLADSGEGEQLDESIVQLTGGSLFPEFTLEGVQFSMDPRVLGIIDVIRSIVIAAFGVAAAFIAGGRLFG